jgi:hypothetical protein
MRIIRVIHAGSVSLALSLPMIVLGGCDGGGSSVPTTAPETPAEAEARAKNIRDAYKAAPPSSATKGVEPKK